MNFVEELRWRGMLHDITPGTEEQLNKESTVGYIGFDPTADSLHVGSLSQIMTLLHFQKAGHKPIALIGGATGMVGDPSGKSQERNLLSEDLLNHNLTAIKNQLAKFLDFGSNSNSAELVNNYDWMKDFSFLSFIRDIGKHLTINYMLAKDSVQSRLESGMSFTEFSYQLLQGYDFLHLYTHNKCVLQMGGSDQWGNIVTGTELIRRKVNGNAFALTTQLIRKSDGTKFGKTESGNVWLDKSKTSPYQFYQFWLNCSDEDSISYIKIFTLFSKEQTESLIEEHLKAPHLRLLQKELAKDITIRVHSEEDYHNAIEASEILFGKGTTEMLQNLSEELLLSVFEGVPQFNISKSDIETPVNILDFLSGTTTILPSKAEARRLLKENAITLNKGKISADYSISETDLLNNKYILIQRGKKNYYLVILN